MVIAGHCKKNKKTSGKSDPAAGHVEPGVEPGMKLGFTSSPRVADDVCLVYGTLISCFKNCNPGDSRCFPFSLESKDETSTALGAIFG